MSNKGDDFNEAMGRFRDAEAALRAIMDSAKELKSSSEELSEARTQLEETVSDSVTRLDNAEKSVADTSSAIFRLTEELKGSARDLGDTAQALRALNPESIFKDITSIRETQERLSERVDALSGAHETASDERAEAWTILRRLQFGVGGCIVLVLVAAALVILL